MRHKGSARVWGQIDKRGPQAGWGAESHADQRPSRTTARARAHTRTRQGRPHTHRKDIQEAGCAASGDTDLGSNPSSAAYSLRARHVTAPRGTSARLQGRLWRLREMARGRAQRTAWHRTSDGELRHVTLDEPRNERVVGSCELPPPPAVRALPLGLHPPARLRARLSAPPHLVPPPPAPSAATAVGARPRLDARCFRWGRRPHLTGRCCRLRFAHGGGRLRKAPTLARATRY